MKIILAALATAAAVVGCADNQTVDERLIAHLKDSSFTQNEKRKDLADWYQRCRDKAPVFQQAIQLCEEIKRDRATYPVGAHDVCERLSTGKKDTCESIPL